MVKDILRSTNPHLRQKSKKVVKIDKKILSLIADLKETLLFQKDPEGVGLAAPQIGKNIRIFVIKDGEETKVFINPGIIKTEKSKTSSKGRLASGEKNKIMEGCLSLPHFYGPLKRPYKVKVKYLSEKGEERLVGYQGLSAQIIQHEIDHLNGILFIDRLLEQKKPLYELKNGEWQEVEL